MEPARGGDTAVAGVALAAALLAALALVPRPFNYIVTLAALPALRGRVAWVSLSPRHITAAAAVYALAFLVDYAISQPPAPARDWLECVVLAPLAEELVFRAVPFALLPPAAAWIFAVVVFGAMHASNALLASAYGLSLALMYRGGGYAASACLHALNNLAWLALALSR
jgi:membrane protease YdiL (CAAX protease family)